MINRIFTLYKNAFGGLSSATWMLAVIMLINRSGSMVLPFLTIYTTESLGFTIGQAGIILSLYGCGSMAGSFLGGWLTDKTGHFYVQFLSLIITGTLFFFISFLETFSSLAIGVFVLSSIAETLRPANASSVSFYAKPENITRAFSLNRMAINLGFAIGPALGGLFAGISYKLLFLVDGITCIAAGISFFFFFRKRKGIKPKIDITADNSKQRIAYKDKDFLIFISLCTCFAIVFFQFLSTLPLYYRNVYKLSESEIGILMGFNGFIVFLFEMILVYILGKRFRLASLIIRGSILVGISFVLLNLMDGKVYLFLAMFIFSMGEIFAMPFMATVTVSRSNDLNRGAYMGFYALSYSTAIVLAPLIGTYIASVFSFNTLWWLAGAATIAIAIGFNFIVKKLS